MDNLDDLKAIWHSAKTDSLPSSKEMLQLIRKFRGRKLRSKWLIILLSLLLAFIMIGVLLTQDFKLMTTYVGGGMVIFSSLLLATTNIRSLKRFYQLDDSSNLEFLAFIEQTRQNQVFYYRKTMVAIVSLSYAGWLLYIYELIYKDSTVCIGIYTAVTIYMAIMWFVVRPLSFKRHAEKLNATRQRLEDILNQFK
jgi:hypothetical protein